MTKKDGTLLSGLMVDIDHFKSVNDRFGHGVGDEVLQFVAKKLISTAKPEDLSARYGGEEFCLILPGTSLTAAAALGERLRLGIKTEFRKQFSYEIDLTISVGVASMLDVDDTTMDLLNRADKALYAAKSSGRNRVVKWGDPELGGAESNEEQKHLSNAQLVRKTMSARS
ncbi:MAG: GGDEF domain-containing protein [Gammaproteobacteria bacterium]|nr:GGDEF domain-containing protein [Gammaproteobacteria bacterium]